MDAGRRVALISSSYFPYLGGVEEHVRRVAVQLARNGTQIEVWTVDRGEHLGTRVVDGVKVRYLPTPLPARDGGALYSFMRRTPSAWRAWRRAHREFRPDLLHVHCFGPNGIYALAMHQWTRTPLAVTSHGETFADDRGIFARSALLRRALREAIKRAVFVTAPSEFTLADLRGAYGLRDGRIVPNGIDVHVNGRDLETDEGDSPYFASIGRLGWMKGFDLAIEAFSRAQLPKGIRLLVGGDGPERGALDLLIAEKGLEGRVVLLGRLAPEEVLRVMAGSLAVIVPSRVEAFGLVALEAWRSGSPLIMTNQGGGPEFVHDGVDGLLVDPTDTEALVGALERVAADAALRGRLVQAGRERVVEFTWQEVAAAYLRLYELVPRRHHHTNQRGRE